MIGCSTVTAPTGKMSAPWNRTMDRILLCKLRTVINVTPNPPFISTTSPNHLPPNCSRRRVQLLQGHCLQGRKVGKSTGTHRKRPAIKLGQLHGVAVSARHPERVGTESGQGTAVHRGGHPEQPEELPSVAPSPCHCGAPERPRHGAGTHCQSPRLGRQELPRMAAPPMGHCHLQVSATCWH